MPGQPTATELDINAIRHLSETLAGDLEARTQMVEGKFPELAEEYDRFVDHLLSVGAGEGALRRGAILPPFLLPDSDGRLVDSTDLLQSGPLVLSFNRGRWCGFCGLELLALAEIYPHVRSLGGEIVIITPEKNMSAPGIKEKYTLPFPVLCDIDNGYALANGLMISIGEAARDTYFAYGIDLASFQGNHGVFLPIPATYVVATDGTILDAFTSPDFRKRMPPEDVIVALKAARA
jgi:peroxiredoxin